VRAGYLALAAAEPERYLVVDGSGDVARTERALLAAVAGRIPALRKAGAEATR